MTGREITNRKRETGREILRGREREEREREWNGERAFDCKSDRDSKKSRRQADGDSRKVEIVTGRERL